MWVRVNLKAAARELGLHYQTAYKLVRSGELVAVRDGRRYDISEAAIATCQARRRRFAGVAWLPNTGTELDDLHHPLDEVRLAALATRSTPHAAFDRAADVLTHTVGDSCVIRLARDGGYDLVACEHVDPECHAMLWHYSLDAHALSALIAPDAVEHRKAFVEPILSTDKARRFVTPETEQYFRFVGVQSVVVAPFYGDLTCGVVYTGRSAAGRPYAPADVELVSCVAALVGGAVAASERWRGVAAAASSARDAALCAERMPASRTDDVWTAICDAGGRLCDVAGRLDSSVPLDTGVPYLRGIAAPARRAELQRLDALATGTLEVLDNDLLIETPRGPEIHIARRHACRDEAGRLLGVAVAAAPYPRALLATPASLTAPGDDGSAGAAALAASVG